MYVPNEQDKVIAALCQSTPEEMQQLNCTTRFDLENGYILIYNGPCLQFREAKGGRLHRASINVDRLGRVETASMAFHSQFLSMQELVEQLEQASARKKAPAYLRALSARFVAANELLAAAAA